HPCRVDREPPERIHFVAIADSTGSPGGTTTGSDDISRGLCERLLSSAEENDMGAELGQPQADLAAEAGTAARYDRGLAVEQAVAKHRRAVVLPVSQGTVPADRVASRKRSHRRSALARREPCQRRLRASRWQRAPPRPAPGPGYPR